MPPSASARALRRALNQAGNSTGTHQSRPGDCRTKRMKRSHGTNRRSAPSPVISHITSGRTYLVSLPVELQLSILSYTSARDTARMRGVCKSLNRLILSWTKQLSREYISRDLSRLQGLVDEFGALKPPSDADSLIEAVRVWTERRGLFSNRLVSTGSMFKLMAHFYAKDVRNDDGMDDGAIAATEWGIAATEFAHMLSRPMKNSQIMTQFKRLKQTGVLDMDELTKLFIYAEEHQPQAAYSNQCVSGSIWPRAMMENTIFQSTWRLTPLLQYPSTSNLASAGARDGEFSFDADSSDLWVEYLDEPETSNQHLPPELGNEHPIRYLGVPKLPNVVSCYSVRDSWARKQIEQITRKLKLAARRRKREVKVAPLLKAAILEKIMHF